MKTTLQRGLVLGLGLLLAITSLLFFRPWSVAIGQQQTYTGHENHSISLDSARVLTLRYRNAVLTGSVIAGYFGKDAVQSVLTQQGSVGMRCYFGRNADQTPTLVIVGVDSTGNDLVGGVLLETWWPCPPFCGAANVLNR